MVATADHEGRRTVSGRSLKAIMDFAVGSHPRAVALLLLVALLSFLPWASGVGDTASCAFERAITSCGGSDISALQAMASSCVWHARSRR